MLLLSSSGKSKSLYFKHPTKLVYLHQNLSSHIPHTAPNKSNKTSNTQEYGHRLLRKISVLPGNSQWIDLSGPERDVMNYSVEICTEHRAIWVQRRTKFGNQMRFGVFFFSCNIWLLILIYLTPICSGNDVTTATQDWQFFGLRPLRW